MEPPPDVEPSLAPPPEPVAEPALAAGPLRRAALRAAICAAGSTGVFLVTLLIFASGSTSYVQLLTWGFLIGLIAFPTACAELLLDRWAQRGWSSALLTALLVTSLGYLGAAAAWIQANWTVAFVDSGDYALAYDRAMSAVDMIFWDDEGQSLCVCLGVPFGLIALARMRRWSLLRQGLFGVLGSLLTVAGVFLVTQNREFPEVLLVLSGGLVLLLPTAGWAAERIERRLWPPNQ